MEVWQAIVLGAVQGLCEFLPVSSSGHLILMQRWLGVTTGGLFFDVMLHIGTLIPVVIVFYREIISLFSKPYKRLWLLIVATIPAMLTGVLLGDLIDGFFYRGDLLSAILLSVTFVLTAAELLFAERISKKNENALPLSLKNAFIMGVAQGVAIAPGLSRSGTVISAGVFSKLNKNDTASFAFLMSIPVVLGAALISGYKAIKGGLVVESVPLLMGMITAAVTGYIAIKTMLKVIKKANYKWFSLYLMIIAVLSVTIKFVINV
ncbi:MAG: undecaprenyl-diphosphate phosphatase [Clostridia bacterium]|nr:undecaprenyl-diphosphate phosphatase [Clostridia bacterium]